MRLINSSTYLFSEFTESPIEPYAIVSHVWEDTEVSYEDLQFQTVNEEQRFYKIRKCCYQAQLDGIQWVWIDTC